MTTEDDTYFGIALTTHRDKDLQENATHFFQYECLLAAIAVMFCRWTVSLKSREPRLLRGFFALLLGFLAFSKRSYTLITAVQIFSYAVPIIMTSNKIPNEKHVRIACIAISAGVSFLLSHLLLSKQVWMTCIHTLTPGPVKQFANYMFPIEEIAKAYNVLLHFVNPAILHKQVATLFFATFNIQVGMGYLGIDFLKKEQARRNQLARMDMLDDSSDGTPSTNVNGQSQDKQKRKEEASRRFQKSAAPFILFTAVPYMLQIIIFGNINHFAFLCLQHDLSRAVRLNNLFDNDSYLIAMANDSATSPGGEYSDDTDIHFWLPVLTQTLTISFQLMRHPWIL